MFLLIRKKHAQPISCGLGPCPDQGAGRGRNASSWASEQCPRGSRASSLVYTPLSAATSRPPPFSSVRALPREALGALPPSEAPLPTCNTPQQSVTPTLGY